MKHFSSLIFCVVTVVCLADDPQSVRELFKEDARLEILYHPDKVEVCLWHPKRSANKIDPGFSLDVYNAGKYVPIPPSEATLITWKLTSDENYLWNTSVDCEYILHARIRYAKGKHTLTADFNFSGGIVIYSLDDEKFSSGLLRDKEADWIFQIIERAIPKDEVVQAIQKRRELMRSERLAREMAKAAEAQKRREAPLPAVPGSPSRAGTQ